MPSQAGIASARALGGARGVVQEQDVRLQRIRRRLITVPTGVAEKGGKPEVEITIERTIGEAVESGGQAQCFLVALGDRQLLFRHRQALPP